MSIKSVVQLMSLFSACLTTSTSAVAQCTYDVEIFAGPDCFLPSFAGAWGINDSGAICGTYVDCGETGHAVIWLPDGVVTIIPSVPPNSPAAPQPFDVNSVGQAAGFIDVSPPLRHAFLFSDGITLDLGTLPGQNTSEATALSEDGTVVGWSNNTGTGPLSAFVWQKGTMSDLRLPVGPNSVAIAISNNGSICGWMGSQPFQGAHAYVWNNGKTIDLGTIFPDSIGAQATGIADNGDVCGNSNFSDRVYVFVRHGFLWSNGAAQDLGMLPGFVNCEPKSLNNSKVVVGACSTDSGGSRAFVWQNGTMTALKDLVAAELNLSIRIAYDINDAGQIVARGGIIGSPDQVAFRLTPISLVPGDFNCNKVVDVDDLLGVLNSWGFEGTTTADFNQDKIVDVGDLLIVIDNWTF